MQGTSNKPFGSFNGKRLYWIAINGPTCAILPISWHKRDDVVMIKLANPEPCTEGVTIWSEIDP
jgi:hypothetical protein